MSNRQTIEVRGFKWPRCPTGTARARLFGEDTFGRWLGVTHADPWWTEDHSRSGVYDRSFVKLVPHGTFWTACFHPLDPVVDVDIVLPVQWVDTLLEEVDLELDVLRFADGSIRVRDQDTFAEVRRAWAMPEELANRAETTCAQVRTLVAQHAEPFGDAGRAWLEQFLAKDDDPRFP
jgi:hypothetical protein